VDPAVQKWEGQLGCKYTFPGIQDSVPDAPEQKSAFHDTFPIIFSIIFLIYSSVSEASEASRAGELVFS